MTDIGCWCVGALVYWKETNLVKSKKASLHWPNFVGSLKSPWILKMILKILELCAQYNTLHANFFNWRRYAAFSHELDPLETSLKFAKKIIEICLNYHWILSKEFHGNMVSINTCILMLVNRIIISQGNFLFSSHTHLRALRPLIDIGLPIAHDRFVRSLF